MLPMKPRVVRTVLLCCLALLLMPVEAFAVSYVSNISVQDGVLSFTYERPEMPPDKTIVRFDLSFPRGFLQHGARQCEIHSVGESEHRLLCQLYVPGRYHFPEWGHVYHHGEFYDAEAL